MIIWVKIKSETINNESLLSVNISGSISLTNPNNLWIGCYNITSSVILELSQFKIVQLNLFGCGHILVEEFAILLNNCKHTLKCLNLINAPLLVTNNLLKCYKLETLEIGGTIDLTVNKVLYYFEVTLPWIIIANQLIVYY